VKREQVLEWFEGRAGFVEAHLREANEALIQPLIAGDWT
jgi:hypothetical protein